MAGIFAAQCEDMIEAVNQQIKRDTQGRAGTGARVRISDSCVVLYTLYSSFVVYYHQSRVLYLFLVKTAAAIHEAWIADS